MAAADDTGCGCMGAESPHSPAEKRGGKCVAHVGGELTRPGPSVPAVQGRGGKDGDRCEVRPQGPQGDVTPDAVQPVDRACPPCPVLVVPGCRLPIVSPRTVAPQGDGRRNQVPAARRAHLLKGQHTSRCSGRPLSLSLRCRAPSPRSATPQGLAPRQSGGLQGSYTALTRAAARTHTLRRSTRTRATLSM